jgi:hypothetical protein
MTEYNIRKHFNKAVDAKNYLDRKGISLKIYPDDFPSDKDYIEVANGLFFKESMTLDFGKHKGKTIQELADTKEGVNYMKWMMDNKKAKTFLTLSKLNEIEKILRNK